jgi:uncharacterized protein with ParB-like and HNH nuclease domain
MKEFKSDLANIGEIFGNYQILYKIPILQRKYVWQEEDVKELLEDIESSLTKDPKSHYFVGGMVFSKDDGERLLVIDGQQRLATLMLLIASVRDHFKQKGDSEQVVFYKGKLGTTAQDPSTGDLKQQYYLELQDKDDPTFRLLLEGKEIKKKNTSVSEQNLIMAKGVTNDFVNKASDLKKYMAYVLSNVHIVRTIAEDQSTAFQIFETLNDRGAHLEPEDLLKNLLLQTMDDKEYDHFANKWQLFVENLMDKGKYVVRVPSFLKHFIMSKGDYISKNDTFNWFKNKKFTHDEIIELLEELEYSSKNYRNFVEGSFNQSTASMKKLLFKQGNIVLLGCLRLTPNDISRISEVLETIAFSYVITETKTNELEKTFCDIAKKAREAEKNPSKVQEVLDDLNNISKAKKEAVKSALMNFKPVTQSDKKKLEYLLGKMASSLDGADYSNYTIEHIMPRTKTPSWPNLPDNEYKNLVSSFGNLTLVSDSDNASLQNKSFIDKQKIYAAQSCRLTSSIAKQIQTGTTQTRFDRAIQTFHYSPVPTKWDKEEIDRRTKSMVALAEFIWFS